MAGKINALMIDREWCSGCQSCEVACRNEHGWPLEKYGIKVEQLGPAEMEDGKIVWDYLPTITQYCDLCADRTAKGGIPTCALHCLANVIEFGDAEELAKKAAEGGKHRAVVMIP